MTGILNWLNVHIGLEGTIFFAFIVMVTSMVIKSIIKIFKDIFIKKDEWGKKAGELKDRVHSIQKEYHDFKNGLSWKQQKSPENRRRLTSLQDRLSFAKKKRKEHLSKNKNKKSRFLLPAFLFAISIIIFIYIKYYTNIFQNYLSIIDFNLH